jgi:hypothetical protein
LKKGGNLRECLREKKNLKENFDDKLIFKWIKELIYGLNYLHKNHVIHRDIKPEYIYFITVCLITNLDGTATRTGTTKEQKQEQELRYYFF